MKINKLSKDLYEIEDFITEEQQKEVLDFMSSLNEEDWFMPAPGSSDEYKESLWYGRQYHGEKPQVLIDVQDLVHGLFEKVDAGIPIAVQRYKQNDSIRAHRDYWIYDLPYHIRYGICIYYNDNYEGGELSYPELEIIHKPKARSLVMHGGNILHESLPVTSDSIRYFGTGFVRGSKEFPVVLNQELFSGIHEEDGSKYV